MEVNGALARPGRRIAVGDTIKLTLGRKTLLLKVMALPTSPTKKAELPYQIVSEEERGEEFL